MRYKIIKRNVGSYYSDIVYYIMIKKEWWSRWSPSIVKNRVVFYDTRYAAEKHIAFLKDKEVQFKNKLKVKENLFLVVISCLFKRDEKNN